MPRLSVEEVLGRIEGPVAPRPEFSDALFKKLLEELERPVREEGRPTPARLPWLRRPFLAAASLALVVILAVMASVVLSVIPRSTAAQAVIRDAIGKFADVPAFRATVVYDRNPEGSDSLDSPEGAAATVQISYPGPGGRGFRQDVVEEDPLANGSFLMGGPGSFFVWDGERLGIYRADDNTFVVPLEPTPEFDPLGGLTWNAPYPNWEDICRRGGSELLSDTHVAGRPARHVRCGDWLGGFSELWIDRETGLVLKIVGQLGQDDFRFGSSPKGGFEVTSVEYGGEFPGETFRVEPPPGATELNRELLEAVARAPAFRAEFSVRVSGALLREETGSPENRVVVQRVWYRDEGAWRKEIVEDTRPELEGGARSFAVWDGSDMGVYNAHDNTYFVEPSASAEFNPAFDLVPESGKWIVLAQQGVTGEEYLERECESLGPDVVAGKPARHLRCPARGGDQEVWLDSETGLLLMAESRTVAFEVRSIEYDPAFPPDAFSFVPPPGATSLDEEAADPYAHVNLRPGQPAPTWTGPLLDGGSLRLEDLKGRPVLVVFLGDWCPPGDPACDVLPQFQRAFEEWAGRAHFVWVNFAGTREGSEQIRRAGDYTFPVVVDSEGDIGETWGVDAIPVYVLLDAEGGVVEVRIRPQSLAQLTDLLSRA